MHKDIKTPIISLYVQVGDDYVYEWDDSTVTPDNLRFSETGAAILNDGNFTAIFDLRWSTKISSALSVGRTLFIWFVLATGALWFNKDANELVIVPIENMIEKVNRIAKNPLEAAQEEENEELALEKNKNKADTSKNKWWKKSKKENPYETVILERTIIKIGALLALGFGEAGTKIIADNISKSGDVDPMIPGTKVVAIFGFWDIRQFSDVTEILQEDIMKFVNEIAEIIHNIVDHYSGSPNKNIGDMFLFVWKFQSEDEEIDKETGIMVPKLSHKVSQIADMSVVSFIKIIAAIQK